ncbi:hypothetical protein EV128_109246 [Rhizobium azibense]|nr:hypothetical protein EV128_109246 [Rhizobium azibense]
MLGAERAMTLPRRMTASRFGFRRSASSVSCAMGWEVLNDEEAIEAAIDRHDPTTSVTRKTRMKGLECCFYYHGHW